MGKLAAKKSAGVALRSVYEESITYFKTSGSYQQKSKTRISLATQERLASYRNLQIVNKRSPCLYFAGPLRNYQAMPIDNTGPDGNGPGGTGPGGTGPGGTGQGGTGPGGIGFDNATLITIPKPPKPEITTTYDGSIPDTIGAGRDVTVSVYDCWCTATKHTRRGSHRSGKSGKVLKTFSSQENQGKQRVFSQNQENFPTVGR